MHVNIMSNPHTNLIPNMLIQMSIHCPQKLKSSNQLERATISLLCSVDKTCIGQTLHTLVACLLPMFHSQ